MIKRKDISLIRKNIACQFIQTSRKIFIQKKINCHILIFLEKNMTTFLKKGLWN